LDRGQDGLDGRFGLGGGGPELLGNPLHHLRFSHRALLRVLGGCATRVAPAVDPVDVAGVLLAWQARYPHGNPAGGKLTIGEVAVSRVVHSVSDLSWKTPHAYCFSSMGCKAVMASEHDVEITTQKRCMVIRCLYQTDWERSRNNIRSQQVRDRKHCQDEVCLDPVFSTTSPHHDWV